MQRCLQLAAMGAGQVAPNPMVGAVLVYAGRIIGEGYHKKYGDAHAEVNCINSIAEADKSLISQSTMYVSLEPCAHFGKTPPCADLIIKNGITNVVVGCRDSFEKVAGRGIEKLQSAGINVIVGVLEKECLELNKRFFTFHEKHRPYIILKWAQSSDGKMAANNSSNLKISNAFTNRLVHKWRTEEAAILVGTNTALLDNPALTARLWPGNNPTRLVLDMDLKLPPTLQLFDGSVKTIVFNKHKQQTADMLAYYKLEQTEKIIPQVLKVLHSLQLQSVIVEGGALLLQSFINENIWDEARVITNTAMQIAAGTNAPILQQHTLIYEEHLQTDSIVFYTNSKQ